MNKAQELMRQAHEKKKRLEEEARRKAELEAQGATNTEEQEAVVEEVSSQQAQVASTVEQEVAATVEQPVVTRPAVEPPVTPQRPATPARQQRPVRSAAVNVNTELPKGIVDVMRDDVPASDYGVKRVQTHFDCANRVVRKWITDFSSDNQFNGGVAITKSQAIEVMLDVMYYDLGINPIGYESAQELREDIINKIRSMG
ncbi:hypothetical protein C2I27_03545 [Priestia megaterium]|uniref:hypothetical protein n=1 Tax=Priestia megaterium TaxID=1404 RepID=UPI000D51AA2B|nr:hypothetical protein [Priestia megaterium]PVC74973.1 hypothetical protein C2I27_03545 [Priestia megaterium]